MADELPVTVEALVTAVRALTPDSDELARVSAAVTVSSELDRVGDRLVAHFVDEARAAGRSWAQIGAALGVSKQAAQQRFVTRADVSFERWTQRARNVIDHARRHAHELGHGFVGTEHLLLGLYDEPAGLAAKATAALGVSAEQVRAEVEARIERGGGPVSPAPFTPRSERAMTLALTEAVKLGHNYIGTEHLLLGLRAEGEGVAAQVLDGLGLSLDALRDEVVKLLAGFGSAGGTRG